MRQKFVQQMIEYIKQMTPHTHKLAIHQTLLKEFMRQALSEAFPNARFILIQCKTNIRETRYQQREYFNLGLEYLRTMSELFDPPQLTHSCIDNSSSGIGNIRRQLQHKLK